MKVHEVIAQLSLLDPEAEVYVSYDADRISYTNEVQVCIDKTYYESKVYITSISSEIK